MNEAGRAWQEVDEEKMCDYTVCDYVFCYESYYQFNVWFDGDDKHSGLLFRDLNVKCCIYALWI